MENDSTVEFKTPIIMTRKQKQATMQLLELLPLQWAENGIGWFVGEVGFILRICRKAGGKNARMIPFPPVSCQKNTQIANHHVNGWKKILEPTS